MTFGQTESKGQERIMRERRENQESKDRKRQRNKKEHMNKPTIIESNKGTMRNKDETVFKNRERKKIETKKA